MPDDAQNRKPSTGPSAIVSSFDANDGGSTVVIFGASGDLTRRKLIPAIYNNFRKKRLPTGLRIIGFARREWSDVSVRIKTVKRLK